MKAACRSGQLNKLEAALKKAAIAACEKLLQVQSITEVAISEEDVTATLHVLEIFIKDAGVLEC